MELCVSGLQASVTTPIEPLDVDGTPREHSAAWLLFASTVPSGPCLLLSLHHLTTTTHQCTNPPRHFGTPSLAIITSHIQTSCHGIAPAAAGRGLRWTYSGNGSSGRAPFEPRQQARSHPRSITVLPRAIDCGRRSQEGSSALPAVPQVSQASRLWLLGSCGAI